MSETIAILALILLLYGAVAKSLERTVIGGAITFTAIGLVFGQAGFGLLDLQPNHSAVRGLAELTLALLLFFDAADADLEELSSERILPRRLLLLAFPGAVLLGILVGMLIFGSSLGILGIALIAAILAPTDAALGKAVITNTMVPSRLRTTLNFESGMNDGLAVPVFLTFMAFSLETTEEGRFSRIMFHLMVEEIGIGILVGCALCYAAVLILKFVETHDMVSQAWRPLMIPALAIACFTGAHALGGSGFIGSFVGGLVFGGLMKQKAHPYTESAESFGDGAALLTWVVFGATVVSTLPERVTWQMIVYAGISLTVVRMLPVWLSLRGTNTSHIESLFLGWFGPRGLASIVFAIMAVQANVPDADTISAVVACTVTLSLVVHGLTAKPLSNLLAKQGANSGSGHDHGAEPRQ